MKDDEIFKNENLTIKTNKYNCNSFLEAYTCFKRNNEEEDFIWVKDNDNRNGLSLTLDDAKFIINSLQEIVQYIEEHTKVKQDDKVKIIKGKFEGFEGRVIDLDEYDNKRPLAIKIFSEELNGEVYINYNEVEKLN